MLPGGNAKNSPIIVLYKALLPDYATGCMCQNALHNQCLIFGF